jgi:hypothetical protein
MPPELAKDKLKIGVKNDFINHDGPAIALRPFLALVAAIHDEALPCPRSRLSPAGMVVSFAARGPPSMPSPAHEACTCHDKHS